MQQLVQLQCEVAKHYDVKEQYFEMVQFLPSEVEHNWIVRFFITSTVLKDPSVVLRARVFEMAWSLLEPGLEIRWFSYGHLKLLLGVSQQCTSSQNQQHETSSKTSLKVKLENSHGMATSDFIFIKYGRILIAHKLQQLSL